MGEKKPLLCLMTTVKWSQSWDASRDISSVLSAPLILDKWRCQDTIEMKRFPRVITSVTGAIPLLKNRKQ